MKLSCPRRSIQMLRPPVVAGMLLASSITGLLFAGMASAASAPLRIAYVTGNAASTTQVWIASGNGRERKNLGPGDQPLISPNGQEVAVSLFGSSEESEEGPALGIYSFSGAPVSNYLSLETSTITPVAWSPDSRYLAVVRVANGLTSIEESSGLEVVNTKTGAVTSIISGEIYGASFAQDGSDRIVFGRSSQPSFAGPTNLYVANPNGSKLRRITNDGRSLDPVWGRHFIVYDRSRNRHESPEYQIWRATSRGKHARRLTHIRVGALAQGLVPLALSASGKNMITEFEGQDVSQAWTVNLASRRARQVRARSRSLLAAGISRSGRTLLLDENSFEESFSRGRIVTLPFAGGRPKVIIAHGSEASWNG